ncbi:unnamed protein product [Bursaphelenchus okinawaensis]|uniref:Uncharacterized protein n=1 Tax=Bursaphelenchus okinawaensis TaxID=465554 RepID=A0A811K403_9BILA|nr:unnamed protein product [Bursaphelenchus okinawaensis]CAG9091836.1 unnamed protein product [Bursaphelenchus okinawaensis]
MVTILTRSPLLFQILAEQDLCSDKVNKVLSRIHDLADSANINMIAQLVIFADVMVVISGKDEISLFWAWALGEVHMLMGDYNFPPPLYSLSIMELMNFICWLAFFGLVYVGRTKYRHQKAGHVNDKYKLSVCLRTFVVLKVMAVCSAIRNFICVNVVISLFAWIFPKRLCSPTTISEVTTISQQTFVAKNVVGDVITNPSAPDETVYRFQELQNNWNTKRLSAEHVSPHSKHPTQRAVSVDPLVTIYNPKA